MSRSFSDGATYLDILDSKIEDLQQKSKIDFGFYGLLEPKTADSSEEIVKRGAIGLKAYLTYPF